MCTTCPFFFCFLFLFFGGFTTHTHNMSSSSNILSHIHVRPWKEFVNTNKFSVPHFNNFNSVLQRMQNNLTHFAGNYLILSSVLLGYGLCVHIIHPPCLMKETTSIPKSLTTLQHNNRFSAPLMLVPIGFVFLAWHFLAVINSTPMIIANHEVHNPLKSTQ